MIIMNGIHITNIDLNLLTVFDAVMREGNATRAARRLGLTQPAVSHALSRLRLLLGDALFVRTPKGMTPTPLAEEMAAPVGRMLEQVERLLSRERAFEPAKSDRRFVIGLSDYATLALLPRIMALLAAEAPGTSLIARSAGHATGLRMLDEGEAELIAGNFPPPPPHIRNERLFMEDFVCAARTGHPAMAGRLTRRRYLAAEHLQVSTMGSPRGIVDDILEQSGARRRVTVTIGYFLAAPLLLENTSLIATEPRRLFSPFRGRLPLAIANPPFALPPFEVAQLWHARHDGDAGHAWLRDVVRRAAEAD